MTTHPAQALLFPHPESRSCADLRISVDIRGDDDGALRLRYRLSGPPTGLRIPPPQALPGRADGLWRHTCFELFVASGAGYREFNFSPSGDWQAYAFAGYRDGGLLEPAQVPRIALETLADGLILDVSLPAANLPNTPRMRLGLCAVLEHADGGFSWWALRHAPGRPDFHHPDTFALELDAPTPRS
jgi:hypothetical protein